MVWAWLSGEKRCRRDASPEFYPAAQARPARTHNAATATATATAIAIAIAGHVALPPDHGNRVNTDGIQFIWR